jgi:hypothetical protein
MDPPPFLSAYEEQQSLTVFETRDFLQTGILHSGMVTGISPEGEIASIHKIAFLNNKLDTLSKREHMISF